MSPNEILVRPVGRMTVSVLRSEVVTIVDYEGYYLLGSDAV
jgi:hypothetical protein